MTVFELVSKTVVSLPGIFRVGFTGGCSNTLRKSHGWNYVPINRGVIGDVLTLCLFGSTHDRYR
jgi:hypothetical protein